MSRIITKTKIVGGSLMVVIPKSAVIEKDIKPGELVEIEVTKPKKDGFGILREMKPFTKEDEDWHD